MKKILLIVGGIILLAVVALPVLRSQTKKHSPEAVVTFNTNGFDMQVNYCQPSKKGRLIFGEKADGALQPYGEYWRAGANEATVFETKTTINFGGKILPAGKYNLYVYPGKDSWDVCLGSDWDRWGAAEADKTKELIRVNVPADNNAEVQEVFTISFDPSGALILHWDQTKVMVPVLLAG